ncbi:MAG TPA: response regulator [Rhodospirillaceae bacterium]|nr:response regulator [Rhodospirillaceae bacterium]
MKPGWWGIIRGSFLVQAALLPTLVVMAIFLAMFYVGNLTMLTQQNAMKQVVENDLESSARLAQINSRLQTVNADIYRLISQASVGDVNGALSADVQDAARKVEVIIADLLDYRGTEAAFHQRETLDHFINDLRDYEDAINWIGSTLEIDAKTAIAFIKPYNARVEELSAQLSAIITDTAVIAKQRAKAATESLRNAAYLLIVAAGGVSMLVALFGYVSGQRQKLLFRDTQLKSGELVSKSEHLSQALSELDIIFQNASIGIAHIVGRHIVRVNKAIEKIFGYESAELINQTTRPLYKSDEACESFGQEIFTAFASGAVSHRFDLATHHKDGSEIICEFVGSMVDAHAPEKGTIWLISDVTVLRRAQKDLLEAKEHAIRLSAAKSSFLANMSHEIRTPMNVIVGFTDNLRRSVENSDHLQQLDKIDQAANHLLAIINDVLDMSKVESGKLSLNVRSFALRSLIAGVCDHFLPIAAGKGLALRVAIDPEVPDRLLGDELRLKQCLFNYVTNALKFTPAGSVEIHVAVDQAGANGLLLRFVVTDTGLGIDAEVLPRLFSRFEQADMSTTRQFGGTGLGLALTKQLVTLMGGQVGVDSSLNQGSRFWFTALLQPETAADTQIEPAAAVGPRRELRDFSGFRLLLAEDTEMNREVMRLLLSKAGIHADVAENGKIAVEMAMTASYDLILMDMRMPVMDGLSATRVIRTLTGYTKTPIIALTANAFEEDRQICMDAGMNDFLSKPLRSDALQVTLSKWLGFSEGNELV